MEENKIIEVPEKKHCKCKVLKVILIIFAIYAFIMGIVKLISMRKVKKHEADNDKREIKEYYAYMDARNITEKEGLFKCALLKNFCGALKYDLSKCTFEDDSFLSLTSYFGAVNIILPKDTNVKVDGLFKASATSCISKEFDENKSPKLYIAMKSYCSAVEIKESEDNQNI